jgi:hypothetical protein
MMTTSSSSSSDVVVVDEECEKYFENIVFIPTPPTDLTRCDKGYCICVGETTAVLETNVEIDRDEDLPPEPLCPWELPDFVNNPDLVDELFHFETTKSTIWSTVYSNTTTHDSTTTTNSTTITTTSSSLCIGSSHPKTKYGISSGGYISSDSTTTCGGRFINVTILGDNDDYDYDENSAAIGDGDSLQTQHQSRAQIDDTNADDAAEHDHDQHIFFYVRFEDLPKCPTFFGELDEDPTSSTSSGMSRSNSKMMATTTAVVTSILSFTASMML